MSISDAYDAQDALGLASLVSKGEVSAEELLEEAIARVESRNPKLNAIVHTFYERARDAIATGLPDGPFRGVPFLLKDLNAEMEGVPICHGSALFADNVSDHDSELVARYRRAGLVIFGRTTSPEFGLTTTTESRVHGETRNPWNLEHTSGGSSGGASSVVAAGIIPAAHASDGGGSIRIPASCAGLFGLKPSRGRMPFGPNASEGWGGMSTSHVVSRTVRDSAALLDATHGPDIGAPYQAPSPSRPYLQEVGADPGKLRIALQRESFNGVEVDSECIEAVEQAGALLQSLGHQVQEAPLRIDRGSHYPGVQGIVSANVLAATSARAEALGRELAESDVEPGTWRTVRQGRKVTGAQYVASMRAIHTSTRRVAHFMEDQDLVLSPTMATPPLPIGRLSLMRRDVDGFVSDIIKTIGFTSLFNATGNPAASVPLGWSKTGLPIGIQIAARWGQEATILRVAAQLEAARPWADRYPSP